jgi:hypothetical protein
MKAPAAAHLGSNRLAGSSLSRFVSASTKYEASLVRDEHDATPAEGQKRYRVLKEFGSARRGLQTPDGLV